MIDEEGNTIQAITQTLKNILTIKITSKAANYMLTEYGFTNEQKKLYYDLSGSKNEIL